MSAFIASGGTAEPYPITNDGWFPDVDGRELRASLRLDGSVTDARLEAAAVNAIIEVNRELASWQAEQRAAGRETLQDVPASEVAGKSYLVHLYHRAIGCAVGAEIAERYRDYSATGDGAERADAQLPTADEYRRDVRWAIRSILGRVHTTVELI